MAYTSNPASRGPRATSAAPKTYNYVRDGGLIDGGRARFEQDAFGFRPAENSSWTSSVHSGSSRHPEHHAHAGHNRRNSNNPNYSTFDNQNSSGIGGTTKSHTSAGNQNDSSDGRSRLSAYSYKSDADLSRFLRRLEGRMFNTLNETYFMPADEEEWARLNKQHISIVLGLGGLYPAPAVVEQVLAPGPDPNVKKRILDLGSGTGIWAVEMAKRFAHCEVVGVDLSPVPLDNTAECMPPNCRFEIDDIGLGLSHFYQQFDLINARFVGAGLRNFRKTLEDVEKCLKPGGMIIWMDGDYDLYRSDANGNIRDYVPFAVEGSAAASGRSWLSRMIYETKRAATTTGQSDLTGMAEALDEGFWHMLDPETCKTASLYTPIGPWATHSDFGLSQQLKYAGALLRQDLVEVNRATRTLLLRAGHQPHVLADWIRRADEELATMEPRMFARFRMAWGRKKGSSHDSRHPRAVLPQTTQNPNDSSFQSPAYQYPYLFVYHTREQSLAEAALRNRNKNIPPPPFP